jgi:hypothetical protein
MPERVSPLPASQVDGGAPEPVPVASLDVASVGSPVGSTPPDVENAVRTRPAEMAPAVDQNAQSAAIRETLARYAAAYSGLNASAARAVWPSVDQRALARAFDGLASQRVLLDHCDVLVNGATARANCSGSAEWTPKVGGGPRTAARRWMFELQNADAAWQIVRAEAR